MSGKRTRIKEISKSEQQSSEGSSNQSTLTNKKPNTSRAREKSTFEEEFETVFWPAYPPGRKVAKATARRSYLAARRSGATAQEIINGLGAAVAHWTRTGKIKNGKATEFVPHPATWLNGERWLDDLSIAADDASPLTANTDSIREKAARWAS